MQLFASPDLELATFTLPAGSPRWDELNATGDDRPLIAFPGTPVEIRHDRRSPIVATRNHAVLYTAGARYRRARIDPAGDRCTYLALRPALATEIRGRSLEESGFAVIDPGAFLLHRAAVRAARAGGDPLAIEEALLRVAQAALGGHRPSRPERRDRGVAGLAAQALAGHYAERLMLDDVARMVHTSPFHLARSFRAETGYTLHRYRMQLRLRAAVDRLCEDDPSSLTGMAFDLGFAGPSHLSTTMRLTFGAPPSELRRRLHRRGGGELRKILQAAEPAAS